MDTPMTPDHLAAVAPQNKHSEAKPSAFCLSRLVEWIRFLGLAAIALSLVTWGLDLLGLVEVCPYCRVQRSAIGLLGLLMILPCMRWGTVFLTLLIGTMGTHVSAAHLFMHIRNETYTWMFTGMAFAAFCIQLAQILLLLGRAWQNHLRMPRHP
jgi:hypothetical protein